MSVAPTVAELPLQDIRFLFGTVPQLRMLPDKLVQSGKVGVGEFKLVAHFPAASAKTEADKKAYKTRHAGFQGGDYSIYYDGTYFLDEINWDATNRAGVHLITQDKYGNTVQFPVVPSKSVPGDLKLLVSEYVESILNPPLMVRCSAIGGRLTPDPNTPKTFDLSVNPQQTKCPVKARPHVPQQYHAEEMTMDHGRYVVDASSFTDAEIEYLDFYLYGAEDATETFYLVTFDVRDGDSQYYPQTIYSASVKDMSDEELITKEFGEAGNHDGNDYYWVGDTLVSVYNKKPMDLKTKELFEEYGLGAESFNSPYAGSGALSGVGLSTSQLTSTVGSGTFDQASLNSSGHMNVFANAESHNRKQKVVADDVYVWLGSDNTLDDAIEVIMDVANGNYPPHSLRDEIMASAGYEAESFGNEEEGSTPVQDPMEFGEMANWTPLDGTPGLKRKRAEFVDNATIVGDLYGQPASFEYTAGMKDNFGFTPQHIITDDDSDKLYQLTNSLGLRNNSPEATKRFKKAVRHYKHSAETLSSADSRRAYATVNFEWTCSGLPDGYDDYDEIEQQVANQIGWETGGNMDFEPHWSTMDVEVDGINYPCQFEYQLQFDDMATHNAENFNAYSDPISDRQVWKINQLSGSATPSGRIFMNRSQASDYIKDLMGKPSGTWKKE